MHHTLKSTLRRLLLCLGFMASQPLWAEADNTSQTFLADLPEAEAAYRVTVNGIPLGIEAVVRLTQEEEKRYRLHFTAKNRLFNHEEIAEFEWQNCQSTPLSYRYTTQGFGIKRGGDVQFNWQTKEVIGSVARYALLPGTLDSLSVSMMARCNLARGDDTFRYDVAEAEGMDYHLYHAIGEKKIKTPSGEWQAHGLERTYPEKSRRSRFWAAPQLDFFMVRMSHQENAFIKGKIDMTRFQLLDDSDNAERHAGNTDAKR